MISQGCDLLADSHRLAAKSHVRVADVPCIGAVATLNTARADIPVLLATAALLGCLTPLWYRSAVAATDEWTTAVRALVNVGRKPLAASLGLTLPATLDAERTMWALVTKLSQLPYHERAAALDRYRADPPTNASPDAGS